MTIRRCRVFVGALLLAAGWMIAPVHLSSQDSSQKRKLLNHEAPAYPTLARNMALEGVVKAEILVEADGTVKSVTVLGGHPVLAQAAAHTMQRWKWEPSSHETHEVVQIKFSRPE